MNKLYISLFDSVRSPVGLGISHYLLRNSIVTVVYGSRSQVKSVVNACYTKSWMHLDSSRLIHSYSSCREDEFSPRTGLGLRLACGYSSDDLDNDEAFINKDYHTFKTGKDHGRSGSIKRLQDILKCSQKQIHLTLRQYPELLLISHKMLSDRLENLKDYGLEKDVLKEYPWFLIYKPKEIALKFKLVSKMRLDINAATPLLHLPPHRLKELSHIAEKEAPLVPGRSRIMHISNVLQCHPKEICKAVAEHLFIQTLPFERISAILDLIIEYDISPQDVLKDIWLFRYNPLTVEKRFKEMRDAGITHIKPWVVRCSAATFSNALRRHVESRNTLGENSSVVEYLSQRLKCSPDTIAVLSNRYPPILKVHVTKIKEVLDYLFSEGFSPQQICQVPRILCHSLETTQERLNQIRDLHYNPFSLMVLCKTKRQFEDYLNRLRLQQKQALTS